MMTKGGHKVQAGTYWNMANGERVDLDQEGVLPGSGNDMYIKAPAVMAIAAGPVVGLIFAVFLTNPSPICVLDEVDAPLDDANIERFCDLLEAMVESTDTRYLIVTHNAVTMSRMHRLFGVTMVERGVSRLVSVDLGAQAELATHAEVFDFARDYLGLLKAAVVAAGVCDAPAVMAALLPLPAVPGPPASTRSGPTSATAGANTLSRGRLSCFAVATMVSSKSLGLSVR